MNIILKSIKKATMKILAAAIYCFSEFISPILRAVISKKQNLIILEGSSWSRYNENTRYLFEYLSRDKSLEVYWITNNNDVKRYIEKLGFKPLFGLIKTYWMLLRAKIVVSSGSNYVDLFGATGKQTYKLCLMHGVGSKSSVYSGVSWQNSVKEITKINKFDYVSFTSKYTANIVGKVAYKLPYSKIKILGYPRNDHLFNKEEMKNRASKKQIFNSLFGKTKMNSRIILYTPTWRKDGLNRLPIQDLAGFYFEGFEVFLEHNNLYFVYTTHPNSKLLKSGHYERIYYLNYEKHETIDINALMPEVDLLINDYSTTSIDYSILNRPQIFVMPDYDEYIMKDSLLDDYRAIIPGMEVHSFDELKQAIDSQLNGPDKYGSIREKLLEKYYDLRIKNSCKMHADLINEIVNLNMKRENNEKNT